MKILVSDTKMEYDRFDNKMTYSKKVCYLLDGNIFDNIFTADSVQKLEEDIAKFVANLGKAMNGL